MLASAFIAHWDDLPWTRMERGHIAGDWQSLTGERSVTVGVKRVRIDPGKWSTPAHVEGSEEEIFYVLDGSGISWQDGTCYDVRSGDCLVHTAGTEAHTLRAGPQGLTVLAFGERHSHKGARLPRAGVSWGLGAWVRTGDPEDHPWKFEAEAGEPDVAESSPRPAWVVNIDDVEERTRAGLTVARRSRDLGSAGGSIRTGVELYDVRAGKLMNPPHAHSTEEEIFVVLDGSGTCELWPSPRSADQTREAHAVRAGHVVARPAGTARAHGFEAGPEGLRLLAYGTRARDDIVHYPRSGKVSLRGVGIIMRAEQLDYWDGEE